MTEKSLHFVHLWIGHTSKNNDGRDKTKPSGLVKESHPDHELLSAYISNDRDTF